MKAFLNKHWPLLLTIALVLGALYTAKALAQTRSATLKWTAVAQAVDGTAISGVTYNVYQGAKGSTNKAKIQTGLTALTTTLSTGLPPGEVCFNVSAQTAVNGEGGLSNEACKSFPFAVPDTTTLTVQ